MLLARVLPSGLNATKPTAPDCLANVRISLPLAKSHNLIVLIGSHPILAMKNKAAIVLPSGLNAIEQTSESPKFKENGNACNSLPLATSHNWMILSGLPLASVLLSWLNASDSKFSECPARMCSFFPVATSHNLIVLSPLLIASVLPSGLKTVVPSEGSVCSSLPLATSHNLM